MGGVPSSFDDSRSGMQKSTFEKRRMTDGTSNRELYKAMSSFLNMTGAGDYELPKLTGAKIMEAGRKN